MITPRKAIETLTFLVTEKPDTISANEKEATELGIEALKELESIRENEVPGGRLPGEEK